MSARKRIAVVFDNLGPYHVARLAASAQLLDVLAVEISSTSTIYDWDAPELPASFQHVRLNNRNDSPRLSWHGLTKALEKRVRPFSPDAIAIPGWSSRASLRTLLWASDNGVPVIVMSDSQEIDFPRTVLKEWSKRRFLVHCQAALVAGTPHLDYLVKLGMFPKQIFKGYDVVDNNHFISRCEEVRANPVSLRRKHRLPERYFLASARFVPRKNLHSLIHAYHKYLRAAVQGCANRNISWHLVLIGDGAQRGELEAFIDQLKIADFVHLPGFKQYIDLPVFYGLATCFVHASTTEQWGLVVNEAMASGLPVIVSSRCGCAPDLVKDGVNGYTYDPSDIDALAKLMCEVASDSSNRSIMGQASSETISHWTPKTFAHGLHNAVNFATSKRVTRPGLFDRTLFWALGHR